MLIRSSWWLRGRAQPGAGTSWLLRERSACGPLSHITNDIEEINEEISKTFSDERLRPFTSFSATRYSLSSPADTGSCGVVDLYVDVVHRSECDHFVVGTISMKPDLDGKTPRTLSGGLEELMISPVASKVMQVLPIGVRNAVHTKPGHNQPESDQLDSDPLDYCKIRAADGPAELRTWFEKANRGRFSSYSYIIDDKTTGYGLSVLNPDQLPTSIPDTERQELLRAVRLATEFRHPELTRVLRRPPSKLTRREWLMIDLLNEEGLRDFGNMSDARARKMSAEAKSMIGVVE